ncbi:hypothetical protein DFP72DRAFT_922755 [Ephemerocybe angulata]|uniref:Uncharacterized protein n=1 Tax=Ephemerocybe angulata TaxID=980116 RepID=A0A8H6HIN9_9AGAR|nr:hypothetical protein DFP72DRAFT_922755 [Tulosesus angulatus]
MSHLTSTWEALVLLPFTTLVGARVAFGYGLAEAVPIAIARQQAPIESAELVLHEVAFIETEGTSVDVVVAEVHDVLRDRLISGEGENDGEDGEDGGELHGAAIEMDGADKGRCCRCRLEKLSGC